MQGEEKKKMAKVITDTYVRQGSVQEINIDALNRDAILAEVGMPKKTKKTKRIIQTNTNTNYNLK